MNIKKSNCRVCSLKEVYNTLYELGIDEYQGFYLGEPSLKLNSFTLKKKKFIL